MMAALRDTTLSTTILDVVRALLPHTAQGDPMPAAKAHDVVTQLSAALKLASLMEQELAVHRFGDAGGCARSALESEAISAFDQLTRDPGSKVVKIDFDKGRKP